MKKRFFIIVAAVLSVLLAGCNGQSNNYDIEGYVVGKDEKRILVTSSDPQDFSSTGGLKEFYNAIWVSSVPAQVKIGQKVQVWIDGAIAESYPAQGKAGKVLVVSSDQHHGAGLSESEAIRKALKKEESRLQQMIPAIRDVNYDKQSDTWTIRIKDANEQGEFDIQIKDE